LSLFVFFMMYMDRACMGIVAPIIMKEFRIDKIHLGWSISAFVWAYAIFQIPGGWLADRFGPRKILSGVLVWWGAFAAATGLAAGAASLAAIRFLFGMGEAAAFPAGSRAIVPWLPDTERAFGQGFQHAGSRLGAALAPLLLVPVLAHSSWRSPFFVFGALGIVVAILWFSYYRDYPADHSGVNSEELALLPPFRARKLRHVPWRAILSNRSIWFLCGLYFCYGWILWMFLTWYPTFLTEYRHLSQARMGVAASAPLLAATITNVVGGRLSDRLARRWNDLRQGRLRVVTAGFIIAGAAMIPGVLLDSGWASLACMTAALAGLELTVAVSWGMCIDLGRDFSGSVSAVMNTCGGLGGATSSLAVAYLSTTMGWVPAFLVASAVCCAAVVLGFQIDPSSPIVSESAS
jgi:MFS family permease